MTTRPRPIADAVSAFFWDAARRGELAALRCTACDRLHHPPDVGCPYCGATTLEPETLSGRGVVYASTVAHQAFDAAFVEAIPYLLALVELDGHPGLRMLGNVIDAPPQPLAVGTPVEVAFEDHGDWALPQFRVVAP